MRERVGKKQAGLSWRHFVTVLHVGERSSAESINVESKQSLLNIANVEVSRLSPPDQKFMAHRKLPHETTTRVTSRATTSLFRIRP